MARPRKDKEKSPPIQFRTDNLDEWIEFQTRAQKAGLKLTAWIKLKCLGKKPKPEDHVPTPAEELRLKGIGALQKIAAECTKMAKAVEDKQAHPNGNLAIIIAELRAISNKLDILERKDQSHDL